MRTAMNVFLRAVAMICCITPSSVFATDPPEISKKSVEKLLQPWAADFEKTRSDVIFIDLKKSEDHLRASKIGGKPYLPLGHKLPVDSSGAEMFLLAQINCAELPAGESFPKSGILQFFIAANDHYGANFEEKLDEENLSQQKDFRVVYHPDATVEAGDFKYPPLIEKHRELPIDPKKTLLMTFRKGEELITTYDVGFPHIVGDETYSWIEKLAKKNNLDEDGLFESVAESLAPTAFKDKLGGYPAFVQEDPRSISSKKKLLLQLNSHGEDGVEMMWGDAGVAGFFIDPADLARKDFSKVMYTWDCS